MTMQDTIQDIFNNCGDVQIVCSLLHPNICFYTENGTEVNMDIEHPCINQDTICLIARCQTMYNPCVELQEHLIKVPFNLNGINYTSSIPYEAIVYILQIPDKAPPKLKKINPFTLVPK